MKELSNRESLARKQREAEELKKTMKTILFNRNPESDFIKMNLQVTFIENVKFQPVRELIDEKFNKFFKKLISLSPHKKELKKNEQELVKVFYNIIYQKIIYHPFLSEAIGMIADAEKKNETDSIVQRLIVKAGLEHFTPIIDEVFAIPSIVLSAFESSTNSYEKELMEAKEKLSDSKKLKPVDPAHKMYMGFINDMLTKNLTKYKVVKNYLNNNENIREKFNWTFFPSRLSKK